jgi:hypothetical protein
MMRRTHETRDAVTISKIGLKSLADIGRFSYDRNHCDYDHDHWASIQD